MGMGCGLACERSLRTVGFALLCWESLMRACVQLSGATWLYFWCSAAAGLRLTYPICEIYWNGQRLVQTVGAGFLDRSVQEHVLPLELFLQEKKLQTAPGFCISTHICIAISFLFSAILSRQPAVFRLLQASASVMKTGVLNASTVLQKMEAEEGVFI